MVVKLVAVSKPSTPFQFWLLWFDGMSGRHVVRLQDTGNAYVQKRHPGNEIDFSAKNLNIMIHCHALPRVQVHEVPCGALKQRSWVIKLTMWRMERASCIIWTAIIYSSNSIQRLSQRKNPSLHIVRLSTSEYGF